MIKKKINYDGMEVEVNFKIAQYLEAERKFIQAQERRNKRYNSSFEIFNDEVENMMFIKPAGFEDEIIKTDELKRLNNAISTLNESELEILKKRFYQDKSLNGIAKEHNVSYQTIQKRINTILFKLNKILAA